MVFICETLCHVLGVLCWQLNNYELQPGKRLRVNVSIANVRLFVGNIPKNKSREEIMDEFRRHTGLSVCVSLFYLIIIIIILRFVKRCTQSFRGAKGGVNQAA